MKTIGTRLDSTLPVCTHSRAQLLQVSQIDSAASLRVWAGLDWTGLDWTGLDWTGLDWTGLDWTGLGWIGLDWTGLDWIGLD